MKDRNIHRVSDLNPLMKLYPQVFLLQNRELYIFYFSLRSIRFNILHKNVLRCRVIKIIREIVSIQKQE